VGCTAKQNFCKREYFALARLTQRWRVLPAGHHKGSWRVGSLHRISVTFGRHGRADIIHGMTRSALPAIIDT
jgi:hypothetical protein